MPLPGFDAPVGFDAPISFDGLGSPPLPAPVGTIRTDIRWTFLVRNPNLEYVGELEVEAAEIQLRHNEPDSFALTVPFDGDLSSPAGQLLIPGSGAVILANNVPVTSGPCVRPIRERDGDKHTITVAGLSDLVVLADRRASPEPATAAPPYDDDTHDVRTGPAETLLKGYVDANAGPGAIADREVSGLAIAADGATGSTHTVRARWNNLLALCQRIGRLGGLGFQIVQTGPTLVFDTYAPENKVAAVKFAVSLGNVGAYSYDVERPKANYVYVGGGGKGRWRSVRERDDATSVASWGRIEAFLDARDVDQPRCQIDVDAADGTWTFSVDLDTTPDLAWNISAAELEAEVEQLASVGAGNVSATGGPGATRSFRLTFRDPHTTYTADTSGLTGGASTVDIDDEVFDDAEELDNRGDLMLDESAAVFSVSVAVLDTGSHQWAPVAEPGVETYNRGDTVAAVIDGVEIPEIIREIGISIRAREGTRIVPILGTVPVGRPEERFYRRLLARIATLESRLGDIERE